MSYGYPSVAVALVLLCPCVFASLPAQTPVSATRARLIKSLDAHSQPGAPFYLSTVSDWKTGNCRIRANTMVEGQVASWTRRKEGAKQEELSLRFEPVPCYGSETSVVVPLLIAVRGPRHEKDEAGLNEAEMKQAMMSMAANRSVRTPGGPGGTAAAGTSTGRAMTTVESQQLGNFNQGPDRDNSAFKTGEVRDVRGVRMKLPAAGSDVTTLYSSRSIAVEPETQFFLTFVVSSGITRPTTERAGAPEIEVPKAGEAASGKAELSGNAARHLVSDIATPRDESASAANQLKICATGCAELDTTPAIPTGSAAWTRSLAAMGLRPRLAQVRVDLDDDASVHFLGDDQVLVTFNYHSLTRRSADVGARPRRIRAVLLSSRDGSILQTQEWPVYDDRQYTWDLGDGRLLAHIGHELVALGTNLEIQSRYQLLGPVVFAEVAPAGLPGSGGADGLIAVATVHEKHTAETHQKLVSFFGTDWPIEEDYDLTMLNTELRVIGTRSLERRPARVALSRFGMITPQHDRGQNWKLEQFGWDGKNATIARLPSACTIGLASLPANLLFTTTCAADQASTFYWILNKQGAALLSGHASATELEQQAASSTAGEIIAVATTESYAPIDLTVGAKISDFHRLKVAAYRISDGKKILEVQADQGSALRQTLALAPSGSSLAVLAGSTLQVYKTGVRNNSTVASSKTTLQTK